MREEAKAQEKQRRVGRAKEKETNP